MDVIKAIDSHRAIRKFTDRALSDDELRAILDAGRRAGSSKNLQRWGFVVVRDRVRLQQLSEVGPFAQHAAAPPPPSHWSHRTRMPPTRRSRSSSTSAGRRRT